MDIRMNLSTIYSIQNKFSRADSIYKILEPDILNKFGSDHFEWATFCHNLGSHLHRKGDWKTADSLSKIAYFIRIKKLSPSHFEIFNSLRSLIKINSKLGKKEEVIQYCKLLDQGCKNLIYESMAYLSETELSSLFHRITPMYHPLYSLIFQDKYYEENLSTLCFNFSLLSKSLILNQRRYVNLFENKIAEFRNKSLNKQSLENELIELYKRSESKQTSLMIENITNQVNDIEKEISRMVNEAGVRFKPVDFDSIIHKLDILEITIEFFTYDDIANEPNVEPRYGAFVVNENNRLPIPFSLCKSEELLKLLGARHTESEIQHINNLYSSAYTHENNQNLFELLWSSLGLYLMPDRNIYYSPAGLMNRINHSALISIREQANPRMIQLISLMDLKKNPPGIHAEHIQNKVLLVGDIDFNQANTSEKITDKQESEINPDRELLINLTRGDEGKTRWMALEGTKREVKRIHEIFTKNKLKPEVLTGSNASESLIKSKLKNPNSIRVIHIATHGYFYHFAGNQNSTISFSDDHFSYISHPLIRSGLILAGANQSCTDSALINRDREDGILMALEISQLDMKNSQILVLSACETGLGDLDDREEVIGLQSAFKMAGASTIMMSLWKVPDHTTEEFMVEFYNSWMNNKHDIYQAFQKAQMKVKEKYLTPFHWAGFVLVQ